VWPLWLVFEWVVEQGVCCAATDKAAVRADGRG
jgi:hypothetical protein